MTGYMTQPWGTSTIPAVGDQPQPPPAGRPLQMVASTGSAGFALQNATPTILTWTAPADGQMHRFQVASMVDVTAAATGGQVSVSFTAPDGSGGTPALLSASASAGVTEGNPIAKTMLLVQPGTTVTVAQTSALTAGAVTIWAEIWAS